MKRTFVEVLLLVLVLQTVAEFQDLLKQHKDLDDDSFVPESLEERRKRQISTYMFQQFQMNRQDQLWDPRAEENWWVLYPYGKNVQDDVLMPMVNREYQINLGFDFPYYGFRFNYTQIYPGGFISFAMPPHIQPPWTFPNPRWPYERDHSFIAPFYADAVFQWIGQTRISNVWHRLVYRPTLDNGDSFYQNFNPNMARPGFPTGGQQPFGGGQQSPAGQFPAGRKKRQPPTCNDKICNMIGRVIDPILLDNITRDIHDGINGANGFRAEFALIVTWERMAYGGAPKAVDVSQFEHVKQWQNTFQLVIATDEIRSYAMFNYARLNWTSSTESGGLNGLGGKQPAMVGFNGGNGTGFTRLPYSGEGRVTKLAYFSNVLQPGRWLHRIDEEIIPGGCSNDSIGYIVLSPDGATQLGGIAVNVSGPCFREGDFVKVVFEEWPVDCFIINRIRARCIMPMFHKTGLVDVRMSRDGGQSYPYIGWFYVLAPHRAPAKVLLRDDVEKPLNRWHVPNPDQLTLQWQAVNLTWNFNARTDISLWGFYEDVDKSWFYRIDNVASGTPNNGLYTFSPRTLVRAPRVSEAWRYYQFGFIQISQSGNDNEGVLWSDLTPFSFYYLPQWEYQYGGSWATDMCIDWYEYDGRRRNFIMDLDPCPCRIEQAMIDLGRFMPVFDCDRDGDTACPFHKGAMHCVQSVQPSWTGAQQQCCYDYQGYLMFTDDWEPTGDYTRFFMPGTPVRAHAFGAFPYKQPPRIPSLSHYMNDLMPHYMCCVYAQHCEFYYWRRQTNGCQDYRPPAAGYIWGEPHIRTYQGVEFSFPGKGYYVLAMSEDPRHRLMVQVRLEQPPETLWHSAVNATVVTGVAIRENESDIVQVFARYPEHRDWRYKTDVYVNGIRRFFDKPRWKYQQFRGVNIRNPLRNMNQSELVIMLDSGAAVQVQESYGMLDVMVLLPPSFNTTCDPNNPSAQSTFAGGYRACYITRGLLGAFTGSRENDLITMDGTITRPATDTYTRSATQQIYEQFGIKWRVDGTDPRIGPVLFQDFQRPIYNPLQFAQRDYQPEFGPEVVSPNASLIFTIEEVKSACVGLPQCQWDYLLTGRREIALTTLDYRNKFVGLQQKGMRHLVSCGPLLKAEGVIKTPVSQNYLSGDIVTFSCKPDYFLHGDEIRICQNGTWTPGWWVWCRSRKLEYALRWLTGIMVSLLFILLMSAIFCGCYRRRVLLNSRAGGFYATGQPLKMQPGKGAMPSNIAYMEREPGPIGAKPIPVFERDRDDRVPSFEREPGVRIAGTGSQNGNGQAKRSPALFESSA